MSLWFHEGEREYVLKANNFSFFNNIILMDEPYKYEASLVALQFTIAYNVN